MTWTVTETPAAVQVVPDDDLILHQDTEACPCAPAVKQTGLTCCGKLYRSITLVHNAMDGRE